MLRLFSYPFAPNPMRVEIVALEKGIPLDVVDVGSLPDGEYEAINPLKQVPSLQLDDGTVITESLIICQYLDEISGSPRLYGETAEDRARIGMWDRRAEMLLLNASVEYGHHTSAMFEGRLKQFPDWAQTLLPRATQMMDLVGDQLERSKFIAGEEISAADFTAALGYFALIAWGAMAPSDRPAVGEWADRMIARPSMSPLRRTMEAFGKMTSAQAAAV